MIRYTNELTSNLHGIPKRSGLLAVPVLVRLVPYLYSEDTEKKMLLTTDLLPICCTESEQN